MVFGGTNHLGNVLAVVSDRRIPVDEDENDEIDFFTASLVSAQDYYPFGMQMPGRIYNAGNYRYGFNGQEKTDDISGNGNHYTAPFLGYDPRLGRRWNIEPLINKFPSSSSYVTFSDNPLIFIDPDGAVVRYSTLLSSTQKKQVVTNIEIIKKNSEILSSVFQLMEIFHEIYTIGDEVKGPDLFKANATFSSQEYSPFKKWRTGNQYEGSINLNYKAFFNSSAATQKNALSEEVFHAGQDFYRRIHNPEESYKDNRLQDEVEARVFRSYSGFVDKTDDILNEFAANSDVQAYFTALKKGDSECISEYEGDFRKAVGVLARRITSSGRPYSYLGGQTTDYVSNGSKAPFFDSLTKNKKHKN